uniref:Uncharacterized protein n=1 Tax=Arundo donax TaxID=35708 RepID=A0A0A8YU16_ARUDO
MDLGQRISTLFFSSEEHIYSHQTKLFIPLDCGIAFPKSCK